MEDGKLLYEKTLRGLRYNSVRISDLEGKIRIEIQKPGDSFDELKKRRRAADYQAVKLALKKCGHWFANLGVSGLMTADFRGENYLVLIRQVREDFYDVVLKLVSGYVEEENINSPKDAVEKEIAEEILLQDEQDRLVRFRKGDYCLGNPYGITSSLDEFVELQEKSEFDLEVNAKDIYVDSCPVSGARILYHLPTNSAQAIFGYHFNLDSINSVYHAEDKKRGKVFGAFLDKGGVYLAGLEDRRLNGKLYCFADRELVKCSEKNILLSEAFVSDSEGFCLRNNISFSEYCKRS